jgi:nucleoside permease NupC
MQVVFLMTFALWAGSSNALSFNLPDVNVVAIVVMILIALAAFFWLTPWGRKALRSVVPRVQQV